MTIGHRSCFAWPPLLCICAALCVSCAHESAGGKKLADHDDVGPEMGEVFVANKTRPKAKEQDDDAGTASVRIVKGVPELTVDAFPKKKK